MKYSAAAVMATALLVAGCASATKRYEQGAEAEAAGSYLEASDRYIDALKKEPGLAEAREGLLRVGPQAIDGLLGDADQARGAGQFTQVADKFHRVDRLVSAAHGVGVGLSLPEGYDRSRRLAMAEAVEALLDAGGQARLEGRWSSASRSYDRVAGYEPSSEQLARLAAARVDLTLAWAGDDLDRGRYRSSFDRAESAIQLAGGPETEAGIAALDIQQAALDLGTQAVVITPLWRTDDAARFMDEEFLAALNDDLELTGLTDPPLFIAVADPLTVRRELRDLRLSRALLTTPEATRLGRGLEADFVVTAAVEVYAVTESGVVETLKKTSTRGSHAASYLHREGTLNVRATVGYSIVDPVAQREVVARSLEFEDSGEFESAVYDGDWTSLELTRNEERLFDPVRQRGYREAIEERLVSAIAHDLADRIFRDLTRRVP